MNLADITSLEIEESRVRVLAFHLRNEATTSADKTKVILELF